MPHLSPALVKSSSIFCLCSALLSGLLWFLSGCSDEPARPTLSAGLPATTLAGLSATPTELSATPTPVIKIGPEATVQPAVIPRPSPTPLTQELALKLLYSTRQGQPRPEQTQAFQLSQNGKMLVSGGMSTSSLGAQMLFWDTGSGKTSQSLAGSACSVTQFALSPDGKWLACQDQMQSINLWQLPLASPPRPFKILHQGSNDQLKNLHITGLTFSADNKRLVGLDSLSNLHIWEISGGTEGTWTGQSGVPGQPMLSQDGKWLAIMAENSRYNPASLKLNMWQMPLSINDPSLALPLSFDLAGPLAGLAWNQDGQTFTTVTFNGVVQRWELAGRREVSRSQFYSPDKELGLVSISPDGKRIATVQTTLDIAVPPRTNVVEGYIGGNDYRVEIWETTTLHRLATLKGHHARFEIEMANHWDGINLLEFSQDSNQLATVGGDGVADIWEVPGGKLLNSFLLELDPLKKVQFSLDDKLVLSSQYYSVKQYEAATGKMLVARTVAPDSRVAFSQNGRQFVEARSEAVRLRDFATDKTLLSFRPPVTNDEYLLDTAFNRAGNRLVLVTTQHIYLCDLARGGQTLATLTGNYTWLSYQFSPDGRYFANADYDSSTLKVWSLDDGKLVTELGKGLTDIMLGFFSPDGQLLLGGSYSQLDIIWKISSGQEVERLSIERSNSQHYLGFSPDGKWLLGSRYEKTRLLWLYDTTRQQEIFNQLTPPGQDDYTQVLFSHDGRYLLTVPPEEYFKLWVVGRP